MEQTNQKIYYGATQLLNEDDQVNSTPQLLFQKLPEDQNIPR